MRAAASLAVLAACTRAPAPAPTPSTPPACGSAGFSQMATALAATCATPTDEQDCRELARAFAACDHVDWRDAAAITNFPDGVVAVHAPPGKGYWEGAVFQARGGVWVVAGIVGGDIK